MNDNEIFSELIAQAVRVSRGKISMSGSLVYHNGVAMFNTDGYNLLYNAYRLTKLLNDNGYFN